MQAEVLLTALDDAGYSVSSLTPIAEGANHTVFDVLLESGQSVICKFAKVRATEAGHTAPHTDTLFGGRLSLERECYLLSLARQQGGLPVPKVYGVYPSPAGRFLMVEKSPGVSFTSFQRQQRYRLGPFLRSLRALGNDFGKLHSRLRFSSFGDIQAGGETDPGVPNFADRFLAVTQMRLRRAVRKGAFAAFEEDRISAFFSSQFEAMRPQLTVQAAPPTMVFTDMHGENFFVDENGVPSGYFDLESSQAAPAALEFYGFRFFLFNSYDAPTFEKAEAAFWEGYREADGPFFIQSKAEDDLIHLLAGCRLLELCDSYHGVVDGLRDNWAKRMKALLFGYMASGQVDYPTLGTIWRERDGQPERPENEN